MSYNTYPQNPFPPNSEELKSSPYVLPIASADTLGGVKVGSNLSIDENGALSAPAPTPPYTPLDYSTTEQATGQKWIDGKEIYFRTWSFEDDLSVSNSAWTNTIITASDMAVVVDYDAIATNGANVAVDVAIDSDYVQLLSMRNASGDGVRYLTLFYTKAESEV